MFRKIIFIIFYFLILSCQNKTDKLKFEKEVAYEIFPLLIKNLHSDIRLGNPPPPPDINYDENGNYIEMDSLEMAIHLTEYKKEKLKLYKDSLKLVIAISDSTYLLTVEEKNSLLDHFSEYKIKLDTIDNYSKYKIDIDKLKADDKLIFKYLSEFPNGSEIWKRKDSYSFFLNGATGFSRIKFDKTHSFGVLKSNYSFGPLNGFGVLVFIYKKNGKWVIDEIVTTTIS